MLETRAAYSFFAQGLGDTRASASSGSCVAISGCNIELARLVGCFDLEGVETIANGLQSDLALVAILRTDAGLCILAFFFLRFLGTKHSVITERSLQLLQLRRRHGVVERTSQKKSKYSYGQVFLRQPNVDWRRKGLSSGRISLHSSDSADSPHLQHFNTIIMAPFSGDGVLWLCLGMGIFTSYSENIQLTCPGVSLFFAIRGIATDLRQVVDLTEIKHVEKEDKIISEGTEEGMRDCKCHTILG
jgi:hypothetical protein